MTLATTTQQDAAAVMEQVMLVGDLSKLSPQQRVSYYMKVCESLSLNPATKPFDYISLQGKLTLYARRDAADQLRKRDRVSITIAGREKVDDVYVVTARATTPDGRIDEAIGAVPLAGKKGEELANCFMKAETKAKRRVTLSICGLGFTDESEVDSIPGAQRVRVDDQGEILDVAPAAIPAAPKPVSQLKTLQPAPEPQPAQATQTAAQRPAQTPRPTQAAPARQAQQPVDSQTADPGAIGIKFGKYAGRTLAEINAADPGYVKWLAANATDAAVKQAAQALAGAQPQAPAQVAQPQGPTQQQLARLMAIAHSGNIPKDAIRSHMQELYGIDSLKQLTRAQYDEVCIWLQMGGHDEEDVPPDDYVPGDEQQETFGDQTAPLW